MTTQRIPTGFATQAFISTQLAIVLAVIVGGAGILAYEWHAAHPPKHHNGASLGHHHHKHRTNTAAN
jgi:hypothetical protein